MECNIGGIDRIIRAILGLAIVSLGLAYHSWWGIVGILLLITSVTGICSLYYPFGINTCKKEKK